MIRESFKHLDTLHFLFKVTEIKRETLIDFQFARLVDIVNHAYDHVPFYRDLYRRHGFHPDRIKAPDDITLIPLVTRELLADAPFHRITDEHITQKRLLARPTSGTTGIPLTLYRTWTEERLLNAFRWRTKFLFGLKLRDVNAVVHPWCEPKILPHRLLHQMNIVKSVHVNAFQPPEAILESLLGIKPDIISGYPGVLAELAGYMSPSLGDRLKPKCLMTGAETLTPELRGIISDGFGSQVLNFYGAHEFNMVAWDCKSTGHLHVCDDNLVLEVLENDKPVKPGEIGDAVGTALHSYAMPLIRYRLGDRVVKGEKRCCCGMPFSTLQRVEGRITDYFTLPDGQRFHPYALFGPVLKHSFSRIRQYHIVQEARDRISVMLVPKDNTDPGSLDQLEADCQALFGNKVRVSVKLTDRIPLSKNGKTLNFRSLVESSCPG